MPSCITHQLIAEEARDDLPQGAREAAERHPDYYFLGAQGPDVFFFYRPLSKKEQNLGQFMHRKRVYDVFTFFLRARLSFEGEERERVTAYLSGYVSHYAADVAFHPYVYAYLNAHGCNKAEHQLIESDWDVYFARAQGKEASGWRFPFSAKQINAEGTLFALYSRLCEAIGRFVPSEASFRRGISLFERYLKFFHKKPHAKLFRGVEKTFGLNPVCSSLYPRKETDPNYLYGEDFAVLSGAESADELFRRAVRASAELNVIFFECEGRELPRELFGKSFLR